MTMILPQNYKILNPELHSWIDRQIAASNPVNLILLGMPGTGKTELANIIYDNYVTAFKAEYQAQVEKCDKFNKENEGKTYFKNGINYEVGIAVPKSPKTFVKVNAYDAYQEYRKALMSSLDSNKGERLSALEKLLNKDLCILDDIGSEPNEQAKGYISQLLINHYNYSKENRSSCIITSNLDASSIQKFYGVRIIDRLYELFHVVVFKNPSFRVQSARERQKWQTK